MNNKELPKNHFDIDFDMLISENLSEHKNPFISEFGKISKITPMTYELLDVLIDKYTDGENIEPNKFINDYLVNNMNELMLDECGFLTPIVFNGSVYSKYYGCYM